MLYAMVCVTCNKYLGGKRRAFEKAVRGHVRRGDATKVILDSTTTEKEYRAMVAGDERTAECKALDDLGVGRYCCRRHFLTDVDIFSVA